MKVQFTILSAALLLASPAAMGDAAAIYAKNCKSCHGADGKGQTTMGKKSKAKDYTTAEGQDWTDADEGLQGKGYHRGRCQGTGGLHPQVQEVGSSSPVARQAAAGPVAQAGSRSTGLRFLYPARS